jgi:hypothetical protein
MDPRIRIRIHTKMSWIRNSGPWHQKGSLLNGKEQKVVGCIVYRSTGNKSRYVLTSADIKYLGTEPDSMKNMDPEPDSMNMDPETDSVLRTHDILV